MASRYTRTLDFTPRAQRTEKERAARRAFPPPDPPLPPLAASGLPAASSAAFDATGWPSLMRVQAVAIPYVLRGDDLIVQSRTGSGKTGAFLLPLFATLDVVMPRVQALILTPTRELARQIFGEFERMAAQSGFKGALVYGGVGYGAQIKSLKEGAQILVGTPGRNPRPSRAAYLYAGRHEGVDPR